MALTVDKTALLLASGTIQRGTWTSAEDIGSDTTRPRAHFSGTTVGTIKAGTQVIGLAKEYVEARTQTPRGLFRKDVIQLGFMLTGEVFEYTGDSMEVWMNRTAQLAYSVVTPSAEDWDIIHVGADAPAIVEAGYLVSTEDVGAREFEIAIYAGLLTPETQDISQTGDDYPTIPIQIEATELAAETDRTKNYGYIARNVT
jgi:hypothetical protein